jgi:hypothetical protein
MLAGLLLLCGKEGIVKVAGCLGAARLQDCEWKSERSRGYWGARHRVKQPKGAGG